MTTKSCILLLCVIGLTKLIEAQITRPSPIPDLTSPTCPKNSAGGKTSPSAESNLLECKLYSCSSCCSVNVTKELAIVPLQSVGKVNFTQCGELSDACSEETSFMECFYQCSPNLFPWINKVTRLVSKLPICAKFCDAWFNKCQMDKSCVVGEGDWRTGLDWPSKNGLMHTSCKAGSTCRNYSDIYQNGENMCNTMWGNLFQYTPDDQPCLHPYDPKANEKMIQKLNQTYQVENCFPEAVSYTDPGLIVGIVLGVLAGICLIGAGIAYFLTRKKPDKSKSKTLDIAPSEEMSTLRSAQPKPDPSHSDSDHD